MKVPSSIQIGGHNYEIVLVETMPDSAAVTHRLQKILVSLEGPYSRKVEGLLHELVHIISAIYCGNRLSEDDTTGISEGLLQVLNQLGLELEFEKGGEW